jgi:hypothetical protein
MEQKPEIAAAELPKIHSLSVVEQIDSKAVRQAAGQVPAEVWLLSDVELLDKAAPTRLEYQLRASLILAFMSAVQQGRKLKLTDIYDGVSSYTHFYNQVLQNPFKFVWLFRPVQRIGLESEYFASIAMSRIGEVLSLPLTDDAGTVIRRNFEAIMRAAEFVSDVWAGNPRNPNFIPVMDRKKAESEQRTRDAFARERLEIDQKRLELEKERLAFEQEKAGASNPDASHRMPPAP